MINLQKISKQFLASVLLLTLSTELVFSMQQEKRNLDTRDNEDKQTVSTVTTVQRRILKIKKTQVELKRELLLLDARMKEINETTLPRLRCNHGNVETELRTLYEREEEFKISIRKCWLASSKLPLQKELENIKTSIQDHEGTLAAIKKDINQLTLEIQNAPIRKERIKQEIARLVSDEEIANTDKELAELAKADDDLCFNDCN